MILMPLSPYEQAEIEMLKLIREAVFRSSSLIGAIREQPTRHNSRNVNLVDPVIIEHGLVELSADFAIHHDLIRFGDVDAYIEILIDALYSGFVEPMEKHFVESISELTTAAGNTVNAAEEGLSPFEAFLKAFEKIEMSLDADDNLVLPTVAANPETIKNLSTEKFGPAEREKLNLLLQRKREELLRNKRVRRLTREVNSRDCWNT